MANSKKPESIKKERSIISTTEFTNDTPAEHLMKRIILLVHEYELQKMAEWIQNDKPKA